jgi:3-phosphoshikimate 1-carboxyvinyltransferase
MTTARPVVPLTRPPDAEVTVPGSKSFTNRALVCAGLASGASTLTGALFADDTDAMVVALRGLGSSVDADEGAATMRVTGCGGALTPGPVELNVRLAATAARFLAPVLALGRGEYRLDGSEPLRRRPIGPLVDALRQLGVRVTDEGSAGHLPVRVDAAGLAGGHVRLRGDISSQFVSGLLLAAPYASAPMEIEVTTDLVSRPYLEVTIATMAAFGVEIDRQGPGAFRVQPARYRPTTFAVEPDASAASYFFAAAAMTAGRVRVTGLGRGAVQGDVRFVDLLGQMGAEVERGADWTEVRGPATLRGIDVDLSDISDTVPTLAVVAALADSSSRLHGIGFIRGKETDRIAAVVKELGRCGIVAEEAPDAIVIHPGRPRAARVETYDDHRMAMAFSLFGLLVEGIEIDEPDVVAKTYPHFFEDLERLRT